jgi:Proliferating cell nuclear antigen, N-terminal domain
MYGFFHVLLVDLVLTQDNFTTYQCDKPHDLGVNMVNFSKILKLMGRDDDIMICHKDDADVLNLVSSDPYSDGGLEFGQSSVLAFLLYPILVSCLRFTLESVLSHCIALHIND